MYRMDDAVPNQIRRSNLAEFHGRLDGLDLVHQPRFLSEHLDHRLG
jgi:hypothetical protein